jgi:hypothetical protein
MARVSLNLRAVEAQPDLSLRKRPGGYWSAGRFWA